MVPFDNTDISHQGHAPSTLFGEAITKIVTPGNVYTLPAEPEGPVLKPRADRFRHTLRDLSRK